MRVPVRISAELVSFALTYEGRCVAFNRDAGENLGVTLRRVGLSCTKKNKARNADIDCFCEGPDGRLGEEQSLRQAMELAETLHVGDMVYALDTKVGVAPRLQSVRLPETAVATCPMTAIVRSENATNVLYEWRVAGDEWHVGESTFTPTAEMGGLVVEVRVSHEDCLPVLASAPVSPWHEEDTYCIQRLECFTKDPQHVRVMSFNMLAPMYLHKPEYVEAVYPYCMPTYLAWNYRFQLMAKEIRAIDADIACLQEVQANKYTELYTLFPQTEFYLTFWPKKTEAVSADRSEGCALAVRKSQFELLDRNDIVLKEQLAGNLVLGQDWSSKTWAPTVNTALRKLGTVAQICTVKRRSNGDIWAICNTHLFYHPEAEHVRLLQVAKLLEIVSKICAETGARPLIVGDLNAMPNSPTLRLLEGCEIGPCDAIWSKCEDFVWKKTDPAHVDVVTSDALAEPAAERDPKRVKLDGLDLKHDLRLKHCFPHLAWTNMDLGFMGFLDHIYIDSDLEPTQALDVPDSVRVKDRYGGLPNRCCGSDHLAVATDIA